MPSTSILLVLFAEFLFFLIRGLEEENNSTYVLRDIALLYILYILVKEG